eukprot:255934_1
MTAADSSFGKQCLDIPQIKFESSDRIGINKLSSIKEVTIDVAHTSQLIRSPKLLESLILNLNRYGICCLNLLNYDPHTSHIKNAEILKNNLYALKKLFGEISFHQKASPDTGILTIDPRNPNSINVANTHLEHAPHTDDSYMLNPASILTLCCQYAAKSGGDTILICGQAMLRNVFSQISKQEQSALFQRDAIEIGRKLPSGNGEKEYELIQNPRPILSKLNASNTRFRLIYRHHDSYVKNVANGARKAWHLMTNYCDEGCNRFQFKLHPGQILVIDNTSIIHGRTPYKRNDLRILYRLNFF